MRPSFYLALGLWFTPALALAHPGHGATEPSSWTHYLTEPLHAGIVAIAAGASVLAFRALRKRSASRQR